MKKLWQNYTQSNKCKNCGKEFDAYIYNLKRGYGIYCSRACRNSFNKLGFKIGHPDFRKTDLKVIGRKISEAKKGINFSEEHRKALSLSHIKRWDEMGRKKCRNRNGRRKCWKCIELRKQIFERDNYTCQQCKKRGIYLEAHHIKSWRYYPKLRHEISNSITLCKECHRETDNYKKLAISWLK